MSILNKIIENKKKEVAERKALYPVKLLEQTIFFSSPCVSLKKYLLREDKTGIIAEFKRKSPSKGIINAHADVERTTIGYMQAGASALSVLTDKEFFGGTNDDLVVARKYNFCPILRKDFTIDEYQVIEAKSIGADAILIIAAVLEPSMCKYLTDMAHSFGLEVVLEVHDEQEVKSHHDVNADVIGVNNRNLKTFVVSLEVSKRLAEIIPAGKTKISESGISSPSDVIELERYGYSGFLMGENFMRNHRPDIAAMDFMDTLRKVKSGMKSADALFNN
jgi:indole-3-glycerol phosphate synthase